MSGETMGDRHLDDEQLSAVLDGDGSGGAHVSSCASCSARLGELTAARDAVAGATVPPLSTSVLDDVIAAAMTEAPTATATAAPAEVVPLTRRRPRTPPPAWLLGAAAAMIALVGVAGVLRTSIGGDDDRSASMSLTSGANDEQGDADAARAPAAAESTAGAGAVADSSRQLAVSDPTVVSFDLANQSDAAELGVLLRDRVAPAAAYAAGAASSGKAAGSDAGAAPTTSAPVDTAMCVAAATQAGGEALGPLLATGTVRWQGQLSEVLVFALRQQTNEVTRQAMVLQRPGCALLAEQRF